MPNASSPDLLHTLVTQVEDAWNAAQDDQLVDRLAAEHPRLAKELYEFFADLVEGKLELDQPRPELADADARARQWLESEGYRQADATRSANETVTPTAGSAVGPGATAPPAEPTARPFVGLLRQETRQGTEALAAALEVTADFLVDISEHAEFLRERAREELADRAERRLKVDRARSLVSLRSSTRGLERAASRQGPFEDGAVTYEKLVARSGLSPEQKQYWFDLA